MNIQPLPSQDRSISFGTTVKNRMEKFLQEHQKLVSVLIFLGSLALSASVFFIPLDPERLRVYGYAGMFVITLLGAMSLFIPGPTMVAAFIIGSTLNPLLVSLAAGAGSALGETTGYSAGYATHGLISTRESSGRWYHRVLDYMTRYPFLTIFILAAIPNFITDFSGLVAGRIGYSYYRFLLATFFGKIIRFALATYLGKYFLGGVIH